MPSKTLIVIIGPTGVGKTELSLQIAEFFCSPILNADSRQLYKDIPIGTAAPTPEEMSRVKHYFVGNLGLDEYYSAAQYELEAMLKLEELFTERDVVVMVGGSMMYIDALCQGIDDIPTVDQCTREMMRDRYQNEGLEPLVRELKLLDPEYYNVCDLKNHKRVIHALEICYMTGQSYSSFRRSLRKERPFKIVKIGLCREREELFQRINLRVEQMMDQGLLQEARMVYPFRSYNSLNTVGFKELFKYFDKEWDLDFAVEKIKRNTRVYSKKQMTWFKKDETIKWFHPESKDEILAYLHQVGLQTTSEK